MCLRVRLNGRLGGGRAMLIHDRYARRSRATTPTRHCPWAQLGEVFIGNRNRRQGAHNALWMVEQNRRSHLEHVGAALRPRCRLSRDCGGVEPLGPACADLGLIATPRWGWPRAEHERLGAATTVAAGLAIRAPPATTNARIHDGLVDLGHRWKRTQGCWRPRMSSFGRRRLSQLRELGVSIASSVGAVSAAPAP